MTPRAKLLAVIAIGIAPILTSYVAYFAMRDSAPWATTNNGALLDPAPTTTTLGWVAATDPTRAMPLGDSHWWLLVAADERCSAECEHAVVQLRQLHVLLNRDQSRVRRALRFRHGVDPASVGDFEARYPKLELLVGDDSLDQGVYVIDPLGNVILRYAYEDAGKPVLKDLQKLLKASQIG